MIAPATAVDCLVDRGDTTPELLTVPQQGPSVEVPATFPKVIAEATIEGAGRFGPFAARVTVMTLGPDTGIAPPHSSVRHGTMAITGWRKDSSLSAKETAGGVPTCTTTLATVCWTSEMATATVRYPPATAGT